MANGNIEYNGKTYHPKIQISRGCDGVYSCSLATSNGRIISVTGRGADSNESLADAVDAFKQELDARTARKARGGS